MIEKFRAVRQVLSHKFGLKAFILFVSLLLVSLVSTTTVFADSSGPRSPGFVSSSNYVAFRGVWVNKPYAMTSNNLYTTAAVTNAQEYTEWLKAGNFGFNIPANATIVGVAAQVERKQVITENVPGTTLGMFDFMTCLMLNGSIITTSNIVNDATPYYWPLTEEVKVFGGPSSLWNLSLTPADINNGNFGFALLPRKAYLVAGYPYVTAYPWVDAMSMTVYYTLPTLDDVPPIISQQNDIVLEASSGSGAVANFAPSASDNVDPVVSVFCSPTSGTVFPIGNTPVTCNAADIAGNLAIPMSFHVIVQDTTAPILTLTGTDPIVINQDLVFLEPGSTWTDAVDGAGNALVGGDIVNTALPGTYIVTYNYTDVAGNKAQQVTRTVIVLDTAPPVITQLNDITLEATSAGGAVANFAPIAFDNVDAIVNVICAPSSGTQFALGTTLVTCSAVDVAGNLAIPMSFNVIVQDTTAPLITLTGIDPISMNQDLLYSEFGATWTDAVDGAGNALIGGDIVNTALPGTYIITYNYTDFAGNKAQQVTRTVIVLDTAPPVINQLNDMTVEATSANGAIASFAPIAQDNVDTFVNVICAPASGTQFALGTTPVICNAADVAGNAATPMTFNVTVEDTTAPIITLSGVNPLSIPYASVYVEPGATWSDAVDGIGNALVGGQTVDTLVPGTYTITYNYTDAAGNAAIEVTRTVVVEMWATIVVSTDVKNWKGQNVIDGHLFTIQLNGADNRIISQTISTTYDRLAPGTYTIKQLFDAKYALKGIIGDNDTNPANGATITVGSGDTINLVFINWKYQINKK